MIVSVGLHSLLVLILLVGPAFLLSQNDKPVDLPLIDFIPARTVDALVTGGGSRKARPPQGEPVAPRPPPPAPQPAEPRIERPEPAPRKTVREIKRREPDPDSLEVSKEKRRRPQVSTTLVTTDSKASRQRDHQAERRAREIASARRQAAAEIGDAIAGIRSSLSSSTSIDMDFGPGGGGAPYANFLQAVKSVYANAWIVPDGVTDDSATVTASVTIARDGSVVASRIVRSSGNAAVDQSVQVTLDRVKYAAPLPDDSKEDQRTVTINFNVKAKQLIG